MRGSYAVVVPLVLLLGGCAGPGSAPGASSLGGTKVNGRVCTYFAADHWVEFAIVFDTREGELSAVSRSSRTRRGPLVGVEVEDSFRTQEGHAFSLRYRHAGPLVIDGREYDLADGRVFLVRFDRGGNECEQRPVALPPRADGLPDEGYVRDELLKAAADDPRLAFFLGIEKQ